MMSGSPTPDVRLVQNTLFPNYSVTVDWRLLDDGTLDETQALATSIVVALGTNSLASPSDPLPSPDSTDRGGWWGDYQADTIWNAWPIGSKLWLLRRAAIESVASRGGATIAHVIAYIQAAIQPFIDNKIASTFTVNAAQVSSQQINAKIVIYRGPMASLELLYSLLWDEQQAATQTAHN